MKTNDALAWLEAHEKDSIARLIEWLRIPSISTDPAYSEDVRRGAAWAGEHLRASGFEVEIRETGEPSGSGHPIVLATSPGDPGYNGPHVLFYGHYDVQPADPLELWESPPFEPVIKPAVQGGAGERIVARGAVDDKGQVMTFLEAMRAWKEAGGVVGGGARYTVLLEGEEESGSKNLDRFIEQNAAELGGCDVCVISDTGMLGRGKPAITYGVRGLAYTEVVLHAADQDLHSGMWGGKAPNPISELVKVLAQLWDADRRITIPGFYEGVRELTPQERDAWRKLGVDERAAAGRHRAPTRGLGRREGYSFIEPRVGAPDRRDQRHHRRVHGQGRQDRHPLARLGESLVPTRRRPGPGSDHRVVLCMAAPAHAPRVSVGDDRPLGRATGDGGDGLARAARGESGAREGLGRRPRDDQDGRVDPGGGNPQEPSRARDDLHGLRARGRSGPLAEREVRA
ncbi:MAG: M20/M25/M40 family metallo-hydrolase [Phycisphaerales bacterium]